MRTEPRQRGCVLSCALALIVAVAGCPGDDPGDDDAGIHEDDDDTAADDDDDATAADDDDATTADDDDATATDDDDTAGDDDSADDDDDSAGDDDDSVGDDDDSAVDACGGDEVCDVGEDVSCPGCAAVEVEGAGMHTCAVREDRSMWCWGGNEFEELGVGSLNFMEAEPLPVVGVTDVVGIGLGGQMNFGGNTCAVLFDGSASCWGVSWGGTPTPVTGLLGIMTLDCTDLHCCASTEDGAAYCWGDNEFGQLGLGFDGGFTTVPTAVIEVSDVAGVSLGHSGDPAVVGPVMGAHSCAWSTAGAAWCWGAGGLGQLGDGSGAQSPIPLEVTGIGPVTMVSAGGESVGGDKGHTCAALQDGTAWCWGSGWAGQLGDGGTDDSLVPVQVSGLTDAVSVASGSIHACALRSSGTVACWGHNYHGQLGDGTNFDSDTPVNVQGLSDVVALTAGEYHNCTLIADGSLRCWGLGDFGQLGDGGYGSSPLPVEPISF